MGGALSAAMDVDDPELREDLARSAYYRDRFETMCIDREHTLDPEAQYFCIRWEQLSDAVRTPYRVAVAVTLEHVKGLIPAA